MDKNHNELRAVKEAARKVNQERSELHSKKQLMNNLQKKIKTTMIGALSSFEAGFGNLWGHGLPTEELTETQKENRELWEEVRTEVLNKGNNQLRAAMDEIAQYTLQWNRFSMDLVVKPKETTDD